MATPLRSHRDLEVFRAAMHAAKLVFHLTLRFPADEKYGLTSQIRNSSRSTCGGIAEAFRKRRYPANWISKLSECESEAAETQVWLEIARDCSYIIDEEFADLYDQYDKVLAQLVIMSAQTNKWCVTSEKRTRQ